MNYYSYGTGGIVVKIKTAVRAQPFSSVHESLNIPASTHGAKFEVVHGRKYNENFTKCKI
jgi:hypothetical protein